MKIERGVSLRESVQYLATLPPPWKPPSVPGAASMVVLITMVVLLMSDNAR